MSKREIYKTNLPHRAIAVYLYLESRANKDRICYPAIGTIARELHLSVSTVKRAIDIFYIFTGYRCAGKYVAYFQQCAYVELCCYLGIIYLLI